MNVQEVESFISLFERSSLSELQFSSNDFSLTLKRDVTHPPESSVLPEPPKTENQIITSPLVGTFYRTPSPDSPPYVEVGSVVEKGQILCTLEAMKIMNHLEADFPCEIVAALADQGSLVEFGQPLF